HFVENAFALPVQRPFDAQRREFVGHHPHAPARAVGGPIVAPIGEHLGGSFRFAPRTEGTETHAADFHALAEKIRGAVGAVGGDDDPASGDDVFTKFRHSSLESAAFGPSL